MPSVPGARPPSIDALARSIADLGLPHPVLVEAARAAVAAGDPDSARARAVEVARTWQHRVVNATGVLLHTNLGRARWTVGGGTPTNVELDLATGSRGDRHHAVGRLAALVTGAEDAMVVNNGAGALMLAIAALAGGGCVAVSRGELVEIGGGFRIPDVMAQSGARLVEVGTTNRTSADDFGRATRRSDVDAIVTVHRSNFTQHGFTASPTIAELAPIGPPVVADLGSGLLDERCPWLSGGPPPWLAGEPGVRQALEQGAALVVVSGDKLTGGPQCGLILGRADLVARCARHPLARVLRCGAPIIGAVQELLLTYVRRDGSAIPFWRQATTPVVDLEQRAEAIVDALVADRPRVRVAATSSTPGGGTLPGVTIPSVGLHLAGDHLATLRAAAVPVIGRVTEGRTVLDLRTVDPDEDDLVRDALAGALRR